MRAFLVAVMLGACAVGSFYGTSFTKKALSSSEQEPEVLRILSTTLPPENNCGRLGPQTWAGTLFENKLSVVWEPWIDPIWNQPGECLPSTATRANAVFGGTVTIQFLEELPFVDQVVARTVRSWISDVESEEEVRMVKVASQLPNITYVDFTVHETIPCGAHTSTIFVARDSQQNLDLATLGGVYMGAGRCPLSPTIELPGID